MCIVLERIRLPGLQVMATHLWPPFTAERHLGLSRLKVMATPFTVGTRQERRALTVCLVSVRARGLSLSLFHYPPPSDTRSRQNLPLPAPSLYPLHPHSHPYFLHRSLFPRSLPSSLPASLPLSLSLARPHHFLRPSLVCPSAPPPLRPSSSLSLRPYLDALLSTSFLPHLLSFPLPLPPSLSIRPSVRPSLPPHSVCPFVPPALPASSIALSFHLSEPPPPLAIFSLRPVLL